MLFEYGGSGSEMGLSMQTKRELIQNVSKRYQNAGKKEKTKILDELVETIG
jgi:hypothetical protein